MFADMESFCQPSSFVQCPRRSPRTRGAAIGGAASTSVNRAVAQSSPFCLPRFASDVPLHVVPGRIAAANATVARFLIQTGMIRDGDIPAAWDDALDVCRKALDAWVKRESGTLQCLSPSFALTAIENDAKTSASTERQPAHSVIYQSMHLCWYESHTQQWPVGKQLEALQQLRPGLGQAVLAVLQHQSNRVYPLFTPEDACDQASYLYWFGEQDEEVMLDMDCGDDEAAREAMRTEMITRQMVNEAFPDWTLALSRKLSSAKGLQRLAVDLPDSHLADIAADALALARLRFDWQYQPEFDGDYVGWGAVLSWREDDLLVRIYDDMANMAYQAEHCELIGELEVNIDTPELMQGWQKVMRRRFKAIQLIDRLIYRLAE